MGGRELVRLFLLPMLGLICLSSNLGFYGGVHGYTRPPPGQTLSVPHPEGTDSGTAPQQVHMSLVGEDKMRISWITNEPIDPKVEYGPVPGAKGYSTVGTSSSYSYVTYHSGQIHEAVLGPLDHNSTYYYRLGDSASSPEYSFKTPPASFPIVFGVVGDLGQTEWTRSTLDHLAQSNYDVLLLPGDLSYADFVQTQWDTFGRLVDPYARQRPWMVTQGNHDVEKIPVIHKPAEFTAYNARWRMPFEESGSGTNLYYSFNVAGVHVIMLGSYTDFEPDSAQYTWLQSDLQKTDRGKTPWLVTLVHAPWYNSNSAHQGEYESSGMKESMEDLLYHARVDVVFTGHVHAYERFTRVYKDKADDCGPVHITIGDGGNREGLANKYLEPKPSISLFREASFGLGLFQVMNATHAVWNWHRNDDDSAITADSVWLTSLSSNSACKL